MQAHQYNQLTEPSTYDQVDGKASTRIHLLLPKNSYKKDNVPEKRNTKAFVVPIVRERHLLQICLAR